MPPGSGSSAPPAADARRRIDAKIIACLLGGTVLLASCLARLGFEHPFHADVLAVLASLLLGVPIVLDAAASLLSPRHAEGRPSTHMQELVALAILASFATEQYLECGAIAFFMLLASFIEDRTAVGARQTIESLIRITPTRGVRVTPRGEEEEVEVTALRPGDLVIVRPGETIPADGVIRAGASTIDQAHITGESLPVERREGEEVFAGTINITGLLRVAVTRAGEDSTLGKVKELILQAARSRPPVVRLLDRYAALYTPAVVMVAAILLFFTRDLDRAISLLLIACPCAIILAGPTAMVAALSAAARLGVLVKTVTDLEVARRVTAIVLDKTGTVTTGQLSVTRLRPAPDVEAAELLAVAASVEQGSRHPVARALVAMAERAHVPLREAEGIQEEAGRGMRAQVDGHAVLVGRARWLAGQGVPMTDQDPDAALGMSLLHVARDGQLLGWIGLEDRTRPGADAVLHALADLGVRTRVMITGDRRSPALKVAQEVGFTDLQAEALPGDKLALVQQLRERGHTVMVVGDGVNDGPALAAGNISVAMGAAGSDVAIHSASIALMNNQLDRIPFLLRLSRRTVAVTRQNLAGVVLYILGMLTLLGFGYLTPLWTAIAHGVSSVAVIFNSARLVREGEELPAAMAPETSSPPPATRLEPVAPGGET
jgi:Cd2+/Zn2+-exporting ATPase